MRNVYKKYQDETTENRKQLIEQVATKRGMTVEEVVEGILPYILAEKPEDALGQFIYIVGGLEDVEPYKNAQKRFKAFKKQSDILYGVQSFQYEDACAVAVAKLNRCDTVYLLDGWASEPIAVKVLDEAVKQRKIICYQEYEV